MDDKLQEVINNMERMNEFLATLNLRQDKNGLVIYGDSDIRLPGLLERVENLEDAVKTLVELDKSRQNVIKGIVVGVGITGLTSGGTLITVLSQVF